MADKFDYFFKEFHEANIPILIECLDLQSHHIVADIGSGTGIIAEKLYEKCGLTKPIWCVDPCAEMQERARERKGIYPVLKNFFLIPKSTIALTEWYLLAPRTISQILSPSTKVSFILCAPEAYFSKWPQWTQVIHVSKVRKESRKQRWRLASKSENFSESSLQIQTYVYQRRSIAARCLWQNPSCMRCTDVDTWACFISWMMNRLQKESGSLRMGRWRMLRVMITSALLKSST